MFAFCSLQVEQDIFEEVYVNFLIVGHTHGCLDRYYSQLSNYIHNSKFIGSPLSLQSLFETAPLNSTNSIKPDINRQIRAFYDYKKFLRPVINTNIKNYQIPHCFRFLKIFDRCYMQYKLYSAYDNWLPVPPSDIHSKQMLESALRSTNINVDPLAAVGGVDDFAKSIGISTHAEPIHHIVSHGISESLITLQNVYSALINAEREGYAFDCLCLAEQEMHNGITQSDKNHFYSQLAKSPELQELNVANSESSGFIFWLDSDGKRPEIDFKQLEVLNHVTTDVAEASCTVEIDDDEVVEELSWQAASSEKKTNASRKEQTKEQKNFILRAQGYARAAANAIKNYEVFGVFGSFQYAGIGLTQKEIDFYTSVNTTEKALEVLNREIKEATTHPFSLLPLEHLSNEQRQILYHRKGENSKDISDAQNIVQGNLIRRGQGAQDGQEILGRLGYTPTIVVKPATKQTNAKANDDPYKGMKLKEIQELARDQGIATRVNSSGRWKNKSIDELRKELNAAKSTPTVTASSINTSCPVFECKEKPSVWCNVCRIHYCSKLFHDQHDAHDGQTKNEWFISLMARPSEPEPEPEPVQAQTQAVQAPVPHPPPTKRKELDSCTSEEPKLKKLKRQNGRNGQIAKQTRRNELEASFREHKEDTRNRRAAHVAVQCACIECIDKPLDLVHPVSMHQCSSKRHKHLAHECWTPHRKDCALCQDQQV